MEEEGFDYGSDDDWVPNSAVEIRDEKYEEPPSFQGISMRCVATFSGQPKSPSNIFSLSPFGQRGASVLNRDPISRADWSKDPEPVVSKEEPRDSQLTCPEVTDGPEDVAAPKQEIIVDSEPLLHVGDSRSVSQKAATFKASVSAAGSQATDDNSTAKATITWEERGDSRASKYNISTSSLGGDDSNFEGPHSMNIQASDSTGSSVNSTQKLFKNIISLRRVEAASLPLNNADRKTQRRYLRKDADGGSKTSNLSAPDSSRSHRPTGRKLFNVTEKLFKRGEREAIVQQ
mmetsp:Transcript_4945/g.14881  ORF Transcript_4945/g.14881 Transcript_4945/m.14881 type:complete len:289 (-) Transcript_4945:2519-3385(-)